MAIVNSDPQTNVKPDVQHNRSTFPLSHSVLDTMRFGEYHPHLCIDGISSDKFPWRVSQDCRSFSLKGPLMQDVNKNLDYFLIPLRAILPLQAERIETIPELGDDVPSDAYTSISNFNTKINAVSNAFVSVFTDTNNSDGVRLTAFFKWLVFVESIYSSGSLLSSLGCHLYRRFSLYDVVNSRNYHLDKYFDLVCRDFISDLGTTNSFVVVIDGVSYEVASSLEYFQYKHEVYTNVSFNQFLEKIRDTSDWYISSLYSGYSSGFGSGPHMDSSVYSYTDCINVSTDFPVDLARLWSYQLCMAEFFSNDKIDYIYSADIYRQYIFYLINASWAVVNRFNWNGIHQFYDYLSAHFFNGICASFSLADAVKFKAALQYFISLFGYKRSLRYVDYFSGARTRPLGVGDTSIPVVGGQVSVIDVTRRIQAQKLLNFVQSVPRKAKEYIKDLFGVGPGHDYHDPLFLARTSDSIGTQEVENTGSDQLTSKQSITAIFRDNSANFEFNVDVVEDCIILGVTSFDIKRSYVTTIDRSFFIRDRYDKFIPQLQFVGDQPIYQHELDNYTNSAFESPFGYTYHDMQYKIIADRAQGAFTNGLLPGYAFLATPNLVNTTGSISPDFIRSRSSELDDFFLTGLSGYSLGTYFHFVVITNNISDSSRPMAANPKIL